MIKINLDDYKSLDEILLSLNAGEKVLLSGTIVTLRDAGHKKIMELFKSNQPLPYDLTNKFIYYAGPTDTPPGRVIGSIGPTTSVRMDYYSSIYPLLKIKGSIGKGERNSETQEIYKKNKLIYFIATGGCGALLSKCIKKAKVVAFEELGCESMKELYIEDFPAYVALDSKGNNIFR